MLHPRPAVHVASLPRSTFPLAFLSLLVPAPLPLNLSFRICRTGPQDLSCGDPGWRGGSMSLPQSSSAARPQAVCCCCGPRPWSVPEHTEPAGHVSLPIPSKIEVESLVAPAPPEVPLVTWLLVPKRGGHVGVGGRPKLGQVAFTSKGGSSFVPAPRLSEAQL